MSVYWNTWDFKSALNVIRLQRFFVLLLIVMLCDVAKSQSGVSSQRFFCEGEGKAKGLAINFYPPLNWEEQEGNRPNVVKKWVSSDSEGAPASFLFLVDADEVLASMTRQDLIDIFSDEAFIQEMAMMYMEGLSADGYETRLLTASSIRVDGEPGFQMDYVMAMKQLGIEVVLYSRQYQVVTQGKMLNMQFAFSSEEELNRSAGLMFSVMNSVVLPGKWIR